MQKDVDFTDSEIYLKKLDAFFLSVGEVDDYSQFAARILAELGKLISYDQGVAIFFNAAGKVTDCYLAGVEEKWGYLYREYYAKVQSQFSLGMKKDRSKKRFMKYIQPITWSELPDNEFITDCIGVRGVKHSFDFPLFDNRGQTRLALAMDRTRPEPFSREEVELLNHMIPHLDNMHRKFFLTSDPDRKIARRKDVLLERAALTKREKEVVSCLCEGIPLTKISEVMDISQTTVYRHLASIYKKLNMNNLQEVLVYFLGR